MSKKKRWFAEGLCFECRNCGRCCRGPGGYVWVTEKEIGVFAEALKMTPEKFCKKYVRRTGFRLALIDNARGDCVFLDENGSCELYMHRPVQCRTFPWWEEVVGSPESWEEEKRKCPGIGYGKWHSCEEIEAGLTLDKYGEE